MAKSDVILNPPPSPPEEEMQFASISITPWRSCTRPPTNEHFNLQLNLQKKNKGKDITATVNEPMNLRAPLGEGSSVMCQDKYLVGSDQLHVNHIPPPPGPNHYCHTIPTPPPPHPHLDNCMQSPKKTTTIVATTIAILYQHHCHHYTNTSTNPTTIPNNHPRQPLSQLSPSKHLHAELVALHDRGECLVRGPHHSRSGPCNLRGGNGQEELLA